MKRKEEFCHFIRQACIHQAKCWDYLREAEELIGLEIEADDIQALSGIMGIPPDGSELSDGWILESMPGRVKKKLKKLPVEID